MKIRGTGQVGEGGAEVFFQNSAGRGLGDAILGAAMRTFETIGAGGEYQIGPAVFAGELALGLGGRWLGGVHLSLSPEC